MWSSLSTQHSALSTQHSALSTQHIKRFFNRLITSVLLFGALLSHATANTFECLLGTDNRYGTYTLTASNVNVSTPAETCEKFFATVPPYLSVRQTVVIVSPKPDPDPTYLRYLDLFCVAGLNQAVNDQVFVDYTVDEIAGKFHYLDGQCSCGTGIAYSNASGTQAGCKTTEKKLFVTLTPVPNQSPPDPRPDKTGGRSTLELIAKVTENGSPKAGVAVTFAVEPIANSGGHDHHDASRPKGTVTPNNPNTPVTDANGEIKATFQADQVAGTHVVAAVCDSCTNKSVTKNVDVKVPDLVSLQPDSGYTLEGNTSDVGVNHKGNHYFTVAARDNLRELIEHFNSFGWKPVGINDASLVWGGKFDSKGYWTTGFHDEHRIGEEVDIGFITGTNASKITKGYYEICREKKVDIPSTILWHDIPTKQGGKYAPHFHVRLSGTYTKGPAAGKYAKCDSDSKTK